MNFAVFANVVVFALALAWLARRARKGAPLSTNVLLAVLVGAALGAAAQAVYGLGSDTLTGTLTWVGVVGGGYVRLLQMVIAPLVLISILAAVTRLGNARSLGAISGGVLGLLLVTTAIAALIGVGMSNLFGLRADGLVQGARELARGTALESQVGEAAKLTIPALLQSFIPSNIFADLAGTRSTSVIGVVIFAILLGLAVLSIRRESPEMGERILKGIEALQALVMRLVRIVIRLTPYGVAALMARVVASSNLDDIVSLGRFVIASYIGMGIILLVHAGMLALSGLSPVRFYQKIWPVLTFAFTSRSSAATIPLSVETQISRLGVSPAIANFAASFGATIGQNACAGLYPAMLAVMIAPSAGIEPTSISFIGSVVLVATIGSFGIAGVGGGATFAALVVLSTLNLPVALAGLLISVEPLIDMGRTAVNVSGSMTAGAVTSRVLGHTNMAVFAADDGGAIAQPATESAEATQPAVPAV
ncbi:MAG: cation:dicarboxylase symporter family transporter [Acidobacteriota bacterium]